MDNEIDKKMRASKKIFVVAIVIVAVVSIIVGAAFGAHKFGGATNSDVVIENISQILNTKEVVAKEEVDFAEYSAKVDEISEALDRIEAESKSDEVKAKFEEVKQSFTKLKESGELAKLIVDVKNGINDEVLSRLKANDKLKSVGEAVGIYKEKIQEFKKKYSGMGDDMQAMFDYSELEKAGEDVKAELSKLKDSELSGVTSEEIDVFYDKIEELREIISK